MGLKEYRHKRDFDKTKEPSGEKKKSSSKELQFVVQEHHARRLHYDFRLEVEGVLKSWAVPKGPSMDPLEKRLAIEVEDHPFEYRTFEGTIPKGSYGAGTVKIWDHGTYSAEGSTTRAENEELMLKGLKKGHLNIILKGRKLKGAFSLVRMHTGEDEEKKQWLLIKKKENESSNTKIHSSQKPNETLFQANQSPMPERIKPMLATLVDEPFDAKDWLFEIKWDGYRAIAEIKKESLHLFSRHWKLYDKHFPAILKDLRSIPLNALLDGEIVVLDASGKPSFQLVQNYLRTQKGTLIYYVFDLLYLEGYDIRNLPLIKRKELLRKLLPSSQHVRYCDHVDEKGVSFFKAATQKGFEGIIAKQAQSPYVEARSRDWLKIKSRHQQETIICGFTSPQGAREKFGALLLGVYEQKKLTYVGRTGSGFDQKKLVGVYQRLKPLIQRDSAFESPPHLSSNVTWVKPEAVCEVKFAEWTKDGLMRQAIFMGLREDKKGSEVVREKPTSVENILHRDVKLPKKKIHEVKQELIDEVKLTNLDKIFWPEEGYTKGDLIHYYQQVAPFILPYLKDRPESLRRYPNGIQSPSFFQKDIDNAPPWLRTETIQHDEKEVNYLFIEDEKSLLYAANLGCIDFNPFSSRFESLNFPDFLVIDLDPEGVSFDQVIEVANEVNGLLKAWKITSVCKTSGATGMHIYIPLGAQYSYEETKQFAKLVVTFVQKRVPDLTSLERSPSKRQKKVYLDYLQNSFGQTIVAPYSVRALPNAPVSTPLKWSEVKSGLMPEDFTMKNAIKRFEKVGDLFKPVLGKGIDMHSILKKIKD